MYLSYYLRIIFGTGPGGYLAVKCLQSLAKKYSHQFPLASHALLNHMFVDDLISGKMNTQSALKLQKELLQLMEIGHLELRKWLSNDPALISSLPEELREINIPFQFDSQSKFKALGIL